MKRHAIHLMSLFALVLAFSFLVPQRAAAGDDDDPPGRVARVSFVRGTVSFEPAGTEDWVSAVVNRPLTTGDKLWNDNDSFSELHLGSAAIRVGSNTGMSFLNLTDTTTQVSLTEGTLNVRVRRLEDDETFEVDTPNLAFTLLRPGNYKVTVNESGDATVVLVREGQGEVTGGGSAYTVHPREVGTFTGTDQIDGDVQSWDDTSDDFDNWCAERESRVDHSVSSQYVSGDVIGSEDLDEYGGWRDNPEYGHVWFPHTTIVGWAPYHYGHWVYIAPWGYTWVDDAPWGFAPFHYGRWVVVGGVWGWVPAPPRPVVVGAVYVRPVYAPALVAWVGGAHFGVGVSVGGNVGWFPLGPREVYVPSYHVSHAYVTNINVTNTRVETTVVNNYYNTTVINHTTVTNVTYVNQRVPGAVMATTSAAFTSARPVSRNVVRMDAREVATARVEYGAPAVAPSRQAVLGAGAVVRVRPSVAIQNRAVVARNVPPPPPPSFDKQREAIQANGGRPLAISQIQKIEPERAQGRTNVRMAPEAAPRNIRADRDNQPNGNRGYPPNAHRDVQPNENGNVQPGSNQRVTPRGFPANNSGNAPSTGTHERVYTDRPQNNRPTTPAAAPNEPVVNPRAEASRSVAPNPNPAVTPDRNPANNSGNAPSTGTHERVYTDRPQNGRPTTPAAAPSEPVVKPQLELERRREAENPRAERPARTETLTPTNNAAHPNNVNPQPEPKTQQPPRNIQPQQNQERRTYAQPTPQPKQQVEKKKEEKPSKPPKEEKPPKNIK
ncbi:MAG: DUF6600 domain-containing protein [Candidatus Acidiferrum sp.]